MTARKALLKLDYRCNNNCYFCWANRENIGDKNNNSLTTSEAVEKIEKAKNLDIDMVVLTGGEPTIRKDIHKIADNIRKTGLKTGLASNMRMLRYQNFLEKLETRGLKWVHGSFYSKNKKTYQKMVRTNGFSQNINGIKNTVDSKNVELAVNHVITRDNIEELEENIDFLEKIGVETIKISIVDPLKTEKFPDMEKVAHKTNKVLEQSDNIHKEILYEGLPFCLVENDENFSEWRRFNVQYMSEPYEKRFFPVESKYVRTPACKGCKNTECPGVYKTLYKKFKEKTENIIRKNKPS